MRISFHYLCRAVRSIGLPLVLPVCFLFLWRHLAVYMANPVILPSPDTVFGLLAEPSAELVGFGSLASNLFISLARVFFGFLIACAIGIPLGLLMGTSKIADRFFTGTIALIRSIPPLAWVPLVLAWFGMGSLGGLFRVDIGPYYSFFHNIKFSMLAIIFIGGFYPILMSSIHGVRQVPRTYVEAALVLGACKRDIFQRVLLPASIPNIINGMRIGLGVAWTCLVSAEMLPGTPAGLGYLIMQAFSVGRTDVVIAGMVCIGLSGATLDWFFRGIEYNTSAWKRAKK